jgi:cytochrome d ubiquinol oxidase subunit II
VTLERLWFVIDAIFWIGFFVLEGFDFGVGMLQRFMSKDEGERRVLINSIGPIWDGNEVWLIVAAAVIFAAFPAWYATMISSLYLAVVLVLLALIARGLSFEYRRKIDDPRWRTFWSWSMAVGSALIPLLLGVALGDLLHGLPIDKAGNYTGNFFDLLVPYGLWYGVTLVSLSLFMGVSYLCLKTTGELHDRAHRWSRPIGGIAVLTVFGLLTWTHVGLGKGFFPNPLEVLAMLAVIGGALVAGSKAAEGWMFMAVAVGMAATVASIFAELFPDVMVSSTNHAYNLTIAGTASPAYTLTVMTVVAVIFFPIVLLYQGWSLHVFKRRLSVPAPEPEGRTDAKAAPTKGPAA